MKGSNPLSVLEPDLRLLSGESRKSESLTGQLTGWLSGPEHPQLREAAERALLKLRTAIDPADDEALAKQSKVETLLCFLLLYKLSPCYLQAALMAHMKGIWPVSGKNILSDVC